MTSAGAAGCPAAPAITIIKKAGLMTSYYLLLTGVAIAAIIFIVSLAFRRGDLVTYDEPMPWQDAQYHETTINADFIKKDNT